MAVVVAYFAYLAGVAVARHELPFARRIRVFVIAVLVMVSIVTLRISSVVPLVYLLIGYWLPALLVKGPNDRLGTRLLEFDHQLFGEGGLAAFAAKAPRLFVEYLELAYLSCYAVVPIGWAWLVLAGYQDQSERFWTTVLLASFGCYGLLPWLPSRAPRAVEGPPESEGSLIRKLNVHVLDRASVQWNTFPSGHTAASLAVAMTVGSHMPVAGVVLGIVAVSIAAGSVVGRYHYAADAIAGAVVAIVAVVITTAVLAR